MGIAVDRHDEVVIWSQNHAVLIFGDAMLRTDNGELRTCPDSWLAPDDGPVRLRTVLRTLTELPIEPVLVSHGPLVFGNGLASLQQAVRWALGTETLVGSRACHVLRQFWALRSLPVFGRGSRR